MYLCFIEFQKRIGILSIEHHVTVPGNVKVCESINTKSRIICSTANIDVSSVQSNSTNAPPLGVVCKVILLIEPA